MIFVRAPFVGGASVSRQDGGSTRATFNPRRVQGQSESGVSLCISLFIMEKVSLSRLDGQSFRDRQFGLILVETQKVRRSQRARSRDVQYVHASMPALRGAPG